MYRVLIVDDEDIIIKQIQQEVPWLDNGFEVVGTETNPNKAIDKIIELKPHVVFTDLRMPQLDGHTFMKKVRELGLDVYFVMLSAYGTFDDARTFFQQEGFDYLLKPLQPQEVQLVLEKLSSKLAKKYPQNISLGNETVNPSFLALVKHVESHYNEKFTLDQLGKQFGLSAGYICNLFAKHYNTTLTCFITKARMEKAVELMQRKEFSLKAIANDCGYSDYFYFNKIFKGYYGLSPSKYIEEHF